MGRIGSYEVICDEQEEPDVCYASFLKARPRALIVVNPIAPIIVIRNHS